MQMYIANCTHQVQHFMYRLPEASGVRMQEIPIGGQIKLSGDLSKPDVDAVVEQHAKYGLVDVAEVDRSRPFVGLCYSVGSPVSVEKLRRAIVHNREVLEERGKENRKEAAVAVQAQIVGNNPDMGALELSVEEVVKDGADQAVNESIRVDANTNPDGTPFSGSADAGRSAGGRKGRGRR